MKNKNISKQKSLGLKQVTERIKNKELVVFTSDKTDQFTVDSVPNYMKAMDEHTRNDTVINNKKVRTIEVKMNHHLKQFNKMFRVGTRE